MYVTAIGDLCEARGVTMQDLAVRTGIPLPVVEAFAAGTTGLPPPHRSEIAEALNVLPEHLDEPLRFDLLDGSKDEVRDEIHYGLGEQVGLLRLQKSDGPVIWHPVAAGALMDVDRVDSSMDVYVTSTLDNRILVISNGALRVDIVDASRAPPGVPAPLPIVYAAELPEFLLSGRRFESTDLSPRQQESLATRVASLPPDVDPWQTFISTRVHLRDGTVRDVDADPPSLVAMISAAREGAVDPVELRDTGDEIVLSVPAFDVVLIEAPLCDYLQEAMDAAVRV